MDVFEFTEEDALESSPPSSPKRKTTIADATTIAEPSTASASTRRNDITTTTTTTTTTTNRMNAEPSPEAATTTPASQQSNSTSTTNNTTDVLRNNPLRGRGTKHSRALKRKAEEEEERRKRRKEQLEQQQRQQKIKSSSCFENNGVLLPTKNGRIQISTIKQNNNDNHDEDVFGWSHDKVKSQNSNNSSTTNTNQSITNDSTSVTTNTTYSDDDPFTSMRKRRRRINGKIIRKQRIAAGSFTCNNSPQKSSPDNNNNRHHNDNDNDDGNGFLISPPPPTTTTTKFTSSTMMMSPKKTINRLSLSQQIEQKLQRHERKQQKIMVEETTTATTTTAITTDNMELDDQDQSLPSSSTTTTQQQQQFQQHSILRISRKVRGAGQDAYAMQDAGTFQMLYDDCMFVVETILACPVEQIFSISSSSMVSNKRSNMMMIILESAVELAYLLSQTKTRRLLWVSFNNSSNSTGNNNNNNNNSSGQSENSAVDGILEVIRHITVAMSKKYNSQVLFYALTQQLRPAASKITDSNSNHQRIFLQRSNKNTVETYHCGLLLDALAAIVSFLSWDCTVDNRASVYYQNAKGARALRQAIFQHEGALMAVLYIVRYADPMVSSILEARVPLEWLESIRAANETGLPATTITTLTNIDNLPDSQTTESSSLHQSPSKTNDGCASVASSHEGDSVSSNVTEDPTKAGRRKKKRKKVQQLLQEQQDGSVLEPIDEDGSVAFSISRGGTMTTPTRSPPRVVFRQPQTNSDTRSRLSFTSDDVVSPPRATRSPLQRKGILSNDDDHSSINSVDTLLLKIHDRLEKTREQFVVTEAGSRDSGTRECHVCQGHRELSLSFGGKDPAGSAADIALKSLNRMIAGKEEGDEHSCLDEVDEPSPKPIRRRSDCLSPDGENTSGMQARLSPEPKADASSEEDDLRNNPLLQTNRMLAASGAIPFLAQGLAETISAMTEELDDTATKSSPCIACLQHLHDKFQGLAPIVDNACLMYDDNRTDLCSVSLATGDYSDTNTGGTLIGSLLVFLKRWLQLQAQKKRKRKANYNNKILTTLLNDTALSALRTLVSLTHDNSLAAEQLAIHFQEGTRTGKGPSKTSPTWSGVHLICRVLFCFVHTKSNEDRLAFDMINYCLNTLANAVGDEPNGDVRRTLLNLTYPGENKNESSASFLQWFTEWILSLTDTFRSSIMMGSFGGANPDSTAPSSASSNAINTYSKRELDKHENEQLMTAGNGCVLLACLLMDPPKSKEDADSKRSSKEGDFVSMEVITQRIREIIMSEMPLDEASGGSTGVSFIRNTLRAYCNLIYFKMGDLSVAVLGPVKELITELEKIQVVVE